MLTHHVLVVESRSVDRTPIFHIPSTGFFRDIFQSPSVQLVGQYPGISATIIHSLSFGGQISSREVVDRPVLIHKVDKHSIGINLGLRTDSGF